jgi:hypothetical protein
MGLNPSSALAIMAFTIILIAAAPTVFPLSKAFAHTFQGGENAEFLTMVQVIKVETSLAGENISDPDIAADHVEHATEALTDSAIDEIAEKNKRIAQELPASIEDLQAAIESEADAETIRQNVETISDLLDEAVQVRIESSQVTNSTVQAVVVANLVNEALEHYGEAVGFEGNMTDMSSMDMSMTGMSDSGMQMSNSSDSQTAEEGGMSMQSMNGSSMGGNEMSTTATTIVSVANHQSAKAFAEKAFELYQDISPQALEGTESAVQALDEAFPEFIDAIDTQASAMDLMNIGHTKIHPNLMTAYNLQVIPEFPLPLLVTLPALAGAVLYGRFKMKKS